MKKGAHRGQAQVPHLSSAELAGPGLTLEGSWQSACSLRVSASNRGPCQQVLAGGRLGDLEGLFRYLFWGVRGEFLKKKKHTYTNKKETKVSRKQGPY